MFRLKRCVVFVSLFYFGYNLELPLQFKTCKRTSHKESSSPSACLLDAIQDAIPKLEQGLPEYGIDSIQPLKINSFTIGEGTGIVHVVQNYRGFEIYNLIFLKIKKLNASITDKSLTVKVEGLADHLKIKTLYDMKGRLLLLPLYGNGSATIDLYNTRLTLSANATSFQKKKVTYLRFTDFKVGIEPKKIVYKFDNLFDGNKAFGDNINKVLNDNNLEVYKDVKGGYEAVIANVCKNIANNIITKVPFDKLFAP